MVRIQIVPRRRRVSEEIEESRWNRDLLILVRFEFEYVVNELDEPYDRTYQQQAEDDLHYAGEYPPVEELVDPQSSEEEHNDEINDLVELIHGLPPALHILERIETCR